MNIVKHNIKRHALMLIMLCAACICTSVKAQGENKENVEVQMPTFAQAQGYVGEKISMGTIKVKTTATTDEVKLDLGGMDRKHFELSRLTIPAGTAETEVEVYYNPKAIGTHKAILVVDYPKLPEKSQTVHITGITTDKNNPPQITLTSAQPTDFTCQAKQQAQQQITLKSQNMAENVKAELKQKKAFAISTVSVYKNFPGKITITFKPLSEGTYNDTLILSGFRAQPISIPLKGIAQKDDTVVETEGQEYKLNTSNPLTTYEQGFEDLAKNKPIALPGWTNSAIQGQRAWWSYTTTDYDSTPLEGVAKVTGFDSKLEYEETKPCKMMLVSPPLDFAHADNKTFTFRVRGDYLRKEQTEKLRVLYIDLQDGKPYTEEIGGVMIPDNQDQNGEWFEYHVDLNTQELADVFFIAFEFTGNRGPGNAATYYIDDFTWGKSNLPRIILEKNGYAMTARQGVDNTSEAINITSANCKEEITLKKGGPNATKFKLSTNKLPKEGGSFTFKFKSDKVGVHEAFVKLSSRGAADQYIALSVNNKNPDAITDVKADENHGIVYDLKGNKIGTYTKGQPINDGRKLHPGVYIIKQGKKTIKTISR